MNFDLYIFNLINPVKFSSFVSGLDEKIFNGVNQFTGKNVCLDSAAIFFAENFQYFVVLLLVFILATNYRKYLKMAVAAVVAAVFSRFIVTEIIRFIFPRIRPFVEKSVNILINYNSKEPSFPSGHAAFFFAMAMVVYFNSKKLGAAFFIFAFLISISRVFSGIHWPSDILAGALVGIFSGWLVYKISKRIS